MSASAFDFENQNVRDEIDLNGLSGALSRRKKFILATTLGCFALALAYVSMTKPRYTAESRILVENQESFFTRPDRADRDVAPTIDQETINSQIQLVTSRDLGRRAIAELGLQGNPEFDAGSGGLSALLRPFALIGLVKDPNANSREERILNAYFDHLAVLSPSRTRVVQVEFSSHDPDLAARAANKIADLYIDLQMQAKRDSAHAAAQSLAAVIHDLAARAAEADARVEAFRAQNGLMMSSANTTLSTQQLGEINTQLTTARGAQAESRAKARMLRDMLKQGRLGDLSDIANNDLVRRISEQRVSVRAQLALESRTLLPGHPRIKELEAQLADIDAQLRGAVDKAARAAENDAQMAGVRVDNLMSELDAQKRVAGAASAEEVQLRELERADKGIKDQLETETAKYQAALARDSGESAPADARIISRALAPSQASFPKKTPILVFATLAGLVFSLASVVGRELLAGKPQGAAATPSANIALPAQSARDNVEADRDASVLARWKGAVQDFGAPAIASRAGAAPRIDIGESENASVVASSADRADATLAAAAKTLITPQPSSGLIERVLAVKASSGDGAVLIAGVEEAGGVGEPALILARAVAREGRAVLLALDAARDASETNQADAAPASQRPGLAELLEGKASFAEVIHRDASSRLHIIDAGGAPLVRADGIDFVLDALEHAYDFVLLAASNPHTVDILAPRSGLSLALGAPGPARDYLHDDLAAAGANDIAFADPAQLTRGAESAA